MKIFKITFFRKPISFRRYFTHGNDIGDGLPISNIRNVNNGELVPSARFNYTTLPKQEYRLAGWLYRSAAAPCRR